jgi:periplasmic protein TonB
LLVWTPASTGLFFSVISVPSAFILLLVRYCRPIRTRKQPIRASSLLNCQSPLASVENVAKLEAGVEARPMRTPVLRTTPSSESQTWFTRVRENLRQLLTPTGLSPSSSNGAPIHLLKLERNGRVGGAQTVSLLTHVGILLALGLFAVQTRTIKPLAGALIQTARERLTFAPNETAVSQPSLGRSAGGGDDNPIPATHGFLPPRSSVQLAQPRLPDNLNHRLPVPVAILDAQAPPTFAAVSNLGLPWMPKDTNSGGPGKDGIGSGKNGGMGDHDGSDAGEGEGDRPYAPGISAPICLVCPYPIYTDEARHVKVQGTVMLRVLVAADGKASEIRVLRGVGYGLEERAVQTVRGWKFKPARDAAQRPIAAWVTIEAVFRLF